MTNADPDLVRCPKCQSLYWSDIPGLDVREETQFRCYRCGYHIKVGACKTCRTRNWLMTKGIEEKGGHRPYYRLKCKTCQRTIGFLIGK